jgi:hypothetical protein
VSFEGESYEQWLRRTAPERAAAPPDPRRWDLAVAVLLGVFFVWVGGWAGWIGLGLVAVLVGELVANAAVQRRSGAATPVSDLRLRGATLVVTLLLSAWLITVAGPEAAPLPVLLVMLDLKDDRSLLRHTFERLRRR